MNRYVKKMGLLVGASAFALGVFASAPAIAFDDVDWTWTAVVNERVTKRVDINIDIDPTGMIMLEDLQIQIGDVTASSTVNGIYNHQPTGGTEGGPVEVDLGEIVFSTEYDAPDGGGAVPDDFVDPMSVTSQNGDVTVDAEIIEGQVDEANTANGNNGTVTGTIDLGTILVEVEPMEGVEFDALTELPEVISAATAVGNNTSIEADTAVQLHEAQVLVGSIEYPTNGEDGEIGGIDVLGLGVTPASVSATSTVYDILNATVDSSATAVGNNLSVSVEAEGPDRLLMADVIQVSVADVTATSSVYDVDLYNYTNLGALDRPIVNSVATAVGNNKSISVNAPDVDVDPGNGGTEP
ncbi:MAG: hypothetical protein AB7O49_22015 [Sphingomonadales bacterium]